MIVIASSPYITVVSDDDSVVDLDDAKLPWILPSSVL